MRRVVPILFLGALVAPACAEPASVAVSEASRLPPADSVPRNDDLPELEPFPELDPLVEEVLLPDVVDLGESVDDSLLDENVPVGLVSSYDFNLRIEMDGYEYGEFVSHSITFDGIVDRVAGRGQMTMPREEFADFNNRFDTNTLVDEIVWVQDATSDEQAVYGLADPDRPGRAPSWMSFDEFDPEYAPVFIAEGGLTVEAIADLLHDDGSTWSRVDVDDDRVESSVEYLASDTPSHADGSIVDLGTLSLEPVRLRAVHDARGVVHRLEIDITYPDDGDIEGTGSPRSMRVRVEYSMPGSVESIAVPVEVEPSTVDTFEMPDDGAGEISERPEIELKIIGAWERDDHELIVSVRADGRVTFVTDRSVFSSTDDFAALWLTEQGHRRLRDELVATGAFDGRGLFAGGEVGPDLAYAEFTIDGERRFMLDDYRTEGIDGATADRRAAEAAVALLSDLGWLDDGDIAEPVAAWVPDAMWVSARPGVSDRSGLPAPSDVPAWPYSSSIEEMSTSTGADAYGEPTLDMCLFGDDVAPLFELLTGVNHAYLRVENGGEIWELNVEPSIPGTYANC